MKKIVFPILCVALASCTSVPKSADSFDTAITQSLGAMMGGIMGPSAGGVQ